MRRSPRVGHGERRRACERLGCHTPRPHCDLGRSLALCRLRLPNLRQALCSPLPAQSLVEPSQLQVQRPHAFAAPALGAIDAIRDGKLKGTRLLRLLGFALDDLALTPDLLALRQ